LLRTFLFVSFVVDLLVMMRAVVVLIVLVTLVSSEDCRQDFSPLCPSGWARLAGGSCEAPLSYAGNCDTVFKSLGLSAEEKQSLSLSCGFNWPCVEEAICERDFAGCPLGWSESSDGACGAPAMYFGSCANRLSFDDGSDKEEIGLRCGVQWPCKHSCIEDFAGATCPESWQHLGSGSCLAPAVYAGGCLPLQNLGGFTEGQKKSFASSCNVPFPCKSGAVAEEEGCEPADQACPSGWEEIGDATQGEKTYCYGAGYIGPCRNLIAVDLIQEAGREAFTQRCVVQWPCKVGKDEITTEAEKTSAGAGGIGGPVNPTPQIRGHRAVNIY